MSSEDKAIGKGVFLIMFAALLAMICILMGLVLTGMIILLIGTFSGIIIALLPEFFPEEEEKEPRKTRKIPPKPVTLEKPSRKIYGIIVGVSSVFLLILLGMVWGQLIQAKDAIIIAVFTIIFQVILTVITELARKR